MTRCAFCDDPIQWLICKDGRRRPFNAAVVPVAEDTDRNGWVTTRAPIRGRIRVVMTRINHTSRNKQDAVRHVVLLHDCPTKNYLTGKVYGNPT